MKTKQKLSKVLKLELCHLLSAYPPVEMKNHLRSMYKEVLDCRNERGENKVSNVHRYHMQALFNFLTIAADETVGWTKKFV
jgi:hypothetical protein